MGTKKPNKGPAPVPPANRPQTGRPAADAGAESPVEPTDPTNGASFHEQDPERRLGKYGGAGEHPMQQPGGRGANDS